MQYSIALENNITLEALLVTRPKSANELTTMADRKKQKRSSLRDADCSLLEIAKIIS